MFRSKKKKVDGRKRREVELERDSVDSRLSSEECGTFSTEMSVSSVSQMAENDLQELEQLRRSRSRSVKSVMTFSSKSRRAQSSNVNGDATGLQLEDTGLLLSFDDMREKRNDKRRKMRPNLVASSIAEVGIETRSSGLYSTEMMEALRNEQSVFVACQTNGMEREGDNDEVTKRNEAKEEEEEFISLGEEVDKKKKSVCTKNRVTFGMYSDGPNNCKKMEEILDQEDEEDDQRKKWEEELMHRGGFRVPQLSVSNDSGTRDGVPIYPTRKNVTCVSLGSVLGKLEKHIKSTSFENERASRELARLEAETSLIETALKQQREELVLCSEKFEYFEEVESFVKGLSFCLRAKVPIITAMEEKIVQERAQRVQHNQQEEQHGVAQEVKYYLTTGQLQLDDIFGLSQLDLHYSKNDTTVLSAHDRVHTSRIQKYQQHFVDSYVSDSQHPEEDMFADAIDEINSLERVYERFQEWKAKFPEVYKNVYCELAQERFFAPYIRAELLYWDPLGVADLRTELSKSWSLDTFAWFRILHQQLVHLENEGQNDDTIDGPLLYQIRDVLIEKVRAATSSYFDPYSSLQTRSLSLVLEEICRQKYYAHVEEAVQNLVSTVLEAFVSETKRTVLVAIDRNAVTSGDDVYLFARYYLERFNALQDNLLTLFVALPTGTIATNGFRCIHQVLQHLLAFVQLCHNTHKTQLVATATQVVRQLSSSSYLLQHLSEPSQEQELMQILQNFEPFLQPKS